MQKIGVSIILLILAMLFVTACGDDVSVIGSNCSVSEEWCESSGSCVSGNLCDLNSTEVFKIAERDCGKHLLGEPIFNSEKGYWTVNVGDEDCEQVCVINQGRINLVGSCVETGVEQRILSFANDLPIFKERTGRALVIEELIEGDCANCWNARVSFVVDDEFNSSIKKLMDLSINYGDGLVKDYSLREGNSLTLSVCEELSGWPEKADSGACKGKHILGLLSGFIEPHFCCVNEALGSLNVINLGCGNNCSDDLVGLHLTSKTDFYNHSKELLFVLPDELGNFLLEIVSGDYNLFLERDDSMACYSNSENSCDSVIVKSGKLKEVIFN